MLVHQLVVSVWETEEMPTEWETELLKILPKKGDKSDPSNYRGIMLLEVAYKILANIVHIAQLDPLEALSMKHFCVGLSRLTHAV